MHASATIRRVRRAAVVAAATTALAMTAATGAVAQDDRAVIDFEDVPANRSGTGAAPAVTDEFVETHGVVFEDGVTPLVFDEESFPPRPDLPRSGSTVITTCYSAEFCSNEITIGFTRAYEEITVWAGYSSSLSEPAALVMEAFAPSGELIDAASTVLGPDDAAIPAENALTVSDGLGRIARVVVRWDDPTRFLSQLILDDLELVPFGERRELTPFPDLLVLDGSDGPVEDAIEFVNTGNVAIPIGSVGIGPDGDVDAFVLLDTNCIGVLDVDESCLAIVLYDPDVAAPAAAVVTVDERAGPTVVVVSVEGFVDDPPPTDPPATDPPPTDPPPTDPPDGGGATPPGDGDGDGSGTRDAVIGVTVIGAAVAGLVALVRRGGRNRRPGTVTAVPRPDPGVGGVDLDGVVSIGVRWAAESERLWTERVRWEAGP